MSKATGWARQDAMRRREKNLEYLLGFCPVDLDTCGMDRDDEGALLRYAAVEWHENGSYWISLFDDIKGCLGYFFSGDGGWLPHVIFDLQTTATYHVDIHCTVGKMTNL